MESLFAGGYRTILRRFLESPPSAADPRALQRYATAMSVIGWLTLLTVLMGLLVTLAHQPFATNDGPVHTSFANLMAHLGEPGRELQSATYFVDLRITPNLAAYLLMAPAINFASSHLVESFIQFLCLCLPAATAWLALRTIRAENAWLAMFVLPLSLNQTFFLGLYNYSISTAMIFVALHCYWRMVRQPSVWRSIGLGVALNVALLAHAAGFVAAAAGVSAMAASRAVQAWRRGRRLGEVLRDERYAIIALAMPVPLLALITAKGSGGVIEHGGGLVGRAITSLRLEPLRLSGGIDAIVALALGIVLWTSVAWAVDQARRHRSGWAVERADAVSASLAALAVSVVLVLLFPDTMGGGWTHSRRFALLPYFWILALLALYTISPRFKIALICFAASATLTLYGSTLYREAKVREQMAPLSEVDRLIGTHCTVLPLVLTTRPMDAPTAISNMSYRPFLQAANRFELHGDRVVLFNYLARLDVYPIKFRNPRAEPQANLFHWTPQQQLDDDLLRVDLAGYERASGLHVDYVLVIGDVGLRPLLRGQVASTLAGANIVYRSSDQRIQLFRRTAPDSTVSACVP